MVTKKPTSQKKRPTRRSNGRRASGPPAKAFWSELAKIGRSIPEAERAKMPRDAARNFDEYYDGSYH